MSDFWFSCSYFLFVENNCNSTCCFPPLRNHNLTHPSTGRAHGDLNLLGEFHIENKVLAICVVYHTPRGYVQTWPSLTTKGASSFWLSLTLWEGSLKMIFFLTTLKIGILTDCSNRAALRRVLASPNNGPKRHTQMYNYVSCTNYSCLHNFQK